MDENSIREKLNDEVDRFWNWSRRFGVNLPNSYLVGDRKYDGWASLSEAFSRFLRFKALIDWTETEIELVRQVITADLTEPTLLDRFSSDELTNLVAQPYQSRAEPFRFYLCLCCKRVRDRSARINLMTCFMQIGQSEKVQMAAFESLASDDWTMTEQYADVLWNAGDWTTQLNVLLALENSKVNKSLLEKFLTKAIETGPRD